MRLHDDEKREYADAGHERLAREGHKGWEPRKAVSIPFPFLNYPRHVVDALVKAGLLGDLPEPSRFPSEPPEGSVLKWVKTYRRNPEQGYTYVALHINGAWYVTGKNTGPLMFDELVKLIGDSPCELATNWVQIPQAPKGELDGLSPEEWFLVAFPQDVVDSDESREG